MTERRVVVRVAIAATMLSLLVAGVAGAAFPATESFLPSVGRGAGKQGSQWYTTIWIYNPGATSVNVQLFLLDRGKDNSAATPYNLTVPAGDVLRFENAVYTLFGVETFGALRIVAAEPVVVNSRIFSQPPEGEAASVGQFFAAVPGSFAIGSGETTQLLGVYQTTPEGDSAFRYNYGLLETTGQTVTVRLIAYNELGTVIGSDTVTLRPYEMQQWNLKDRLLPSPSTTNARIEAEVIGGNGKVVAFGSGLANVSNDPSTFEMQFAGTSGGGGGSISGVTAGAGLTGGGTSGTVTLDVGAGKNIVVGADTVALDDVIEVTAAKAMGSNGSLNAQIAPNPVNANYGWAAVADNAGNVRAEMWSGSQDSGVGILRTKGPNDSTNVVLTANPDDLDLGQVQLHDDAGEARVWGWIDAQTKAGAFGTLGPNGSDNVNLGWHVNNPDLGWLSVLDDQSRERVQIFIGNTDKSGQVWTYGPNNSPNVSLASTYNDPNRGSIAVFNASGGVVASLSSTDSGGAIVSSASKSVFDYPGQDGSRIVYGRLEGPESGLYERGRIVLNDGRASIALPDHFVALADLDTLTVQLTPHSLASWGVAVEAIEGTIVAVRELAGGSGSYEVSYLVHAARRGTSREPVVMSEEEVARRFGVGRFGVVPSAEAPPRKSGASLVRGESGTPARRPTGGVERP